MVTATKAVAVATTVPTMAPANTSDNQCTFSARRVHAIITMPIVAITMVTRRTANDVSWIYSSAATAINKAVVFAT
jgi:hypothetical protein